MSGQYPSIYISHAWGGESEKIVQAIVKRFEKEGLDVVLDKKDLGYRESIRSFMENLGQADAIIIVVSQKYLHSEYCMFELLQIYENKNILERIFPVVLDEVDIAKSTDRLELVKYWEDQTSQLEDKIRELKSLSHIEGITEDLNLYNSIRNKIAKLTSILKDINTLNIGLHKDSDFEDLLGAIKKKLDSRSQESGQKYAQSNDEQTEYSLRAKVHHKKTSKNQKWKYFLILPVLLVLAAAYYAMSSNEGNSYDEPVQEGELGSPEMYSPEDSMTFADKQLDLEKKADFEELNVEESVPLQTTNTKSEISERNKETTRYVKRPSTDYKKVQTETNKPSSGTEKPVDIKEDKLGEDIPEPQAKETKNNLSEEVKMRSINLEVPVQFLEAEITQDISSNRVQKDDVLFLHNLTEIKVGQHIVVWKGARVRTRVNDAKASYDGGRAALALQFEAVETVSGTWIELQYPEYANKKKGEVIFKKGTKIPKLKTKTSNVQIQIPIQ